MEFDEIQVVDILPKDIERVAIEEYYHLFTSIYGTTPFRRFDKIKYTTEKTKLSVKDLSDQNLMMAIKAAEPLVNVRYAIKRKDGKIVAIARFKLLQNNIASLYDIIFLDYPRSDEKYDLVQEMIQFVEKYLMDLGIDEMYYEISKHDADTLNAACDLGWGILDPTQDDSREYRTYLLINNERMRGCNEPTRSRKQTSRTN